MVLFFVKFIIIERGYLFFSDGKIAGGRVSEYLLERSRIVGQVTICNILSLEWIEIK